MKRTFTSSVFLGLLCAICLIVATTTRASAQALGFLRGKNTRPVLSFPLLSKASTPGFKFQAYVGTELDRQTTISNVFRGRDLYTGLGAGYMVPVGHTGANLNLQLGYTANTSTFVRTGNFTRGEWGYGFSLKFPFDTGK